MRERFTLAGDIEPGQITRVIDADGNEQPVRWGLLRRWTGHGGKRGPMIYTALAAETGAMPLLREARAKQRCAVLADGIYERVGVGKPFVWRGAGRVVVLPGVCATSRDDGQPSFALLEGPDFIAVDRDAWLVRGELVADPVEWRTNLAQRELF